MSFIQDTVECQDCGYEMNVVQGIVGMTSVGEWPKDCPKCHGIIKKLRSGWSAKNEEPSPKPTEKEWWYDEGESIANGADAYGVIKRLLAEQRRRTIEKCQSEVANLRSEFANTPLDKREDGWVWLGKLNDRLSALNKQEK